MPLPQSEYTSEPDHRRQWISGFVGSAGDAVVTAREALLWTDSRYWVQAGRQLDCNWRLMKKGDEGVSTTPAAAASRHSLLDRA